MGMAIPILKRRLNNDLANLSEDITVTGLGEIVGFPLVLHVEIHGVEGYSSPGITRNEHEFSLIISEDFPYERPRVRWESEIFHPNIMTPEEGGTVCVMRLDHWDFNTGLDVFINELSELVKNPNPDNPLGSETCIAAANWFRNGCI